MSQAESASADSTTGAPRVWLFKASHDLLWGSGLAYLLVFLLMVWNIERVMTYAPAWLTMSLVVLVSMPHYGATLLRAYERKEDRSAYRLYTTYSTIALAIAFLVGIRDFWVGSLLFTLYLTWSPWHYTAQNFGICLMSLKRQGVEVDGRTRRFLRFSLNLSFAVAALHIHSPALYAPFSGARVQFLSLNLPAMLVDVAMFATLLLYAVSTALLVASVAKKGIRPAAPTLGLVLVQGVWFVLPAVARNWFPMSGPAVLRSSHAVYTFTWIALAHAAQYLWITAYFAERSGRASSTASFYRRAVVFGCTLWAAPLLLFAPGALGRIPYDLGLASVTAAVINLHHFILDGAVWKLRESRVGRVLLQPGGPERVETTAEKVRGSSPKWKLARARPWAGAVGALSVVVLLFGVMEEYELSRRLRTGDTDGAARALERLAWIGRDSAFTRAEIGALRMKEGNAADAEYHFGIGVELFPTASGLIQLGEALASQGKSNDSLQAFASAVLLEPGNVTAKMRLAIAHADRGEIDRAQALLGECGAPENDTPSARALRERLQARLLD